MRLKVIVADGKKNYASSLPQHKTELELCTSGQGFSER
jgi:hypothetical protein